MPIQLLGDSKYLILGLVILLIITLNLGLWAALKRKNQSHKNEWINKLSFSLRNPWQQEDEQLQELSNRVNRLRNHSMPETGISSENKTETQKKPVKKP